jgi:AAA domain
MRVLQVDRRTPFTPPRSPLCRSNLFVGVGVRGGAVRQHPRAHKRGHSDLSYCKRHFLAGEWKNTEQRVPLTWTPCHFGGQRPWFVSQRAAPHHTLPHSTAHFGAVASEPVGLVGDRVPAKQAGLFSGEGGTGKTILELMKDVAGKDWCGSLPTLGPAFYLGAEDDENEVHIRASPPSPSITV